MKAAILTKFGSPDVIEIQELPQPTPQPDEILVRTLATTITAADARIRAQNFPPGFNFISKLMFGFSKPKTKILGSELVGIVEQASAKNLSFHVGDTVIVFNDAKLGCHAEYVKIKATTPIIKKPESLTTDQAAALCFGGVTALTFLDRAKLKPGESILINGATGSVGSAAVQIAKAFGATVTAVCSSKNTEVAQQLGADYVFNYDKHDLTTINQKYDAVFDAVGNIPLSHRNKYLKSNGRHIQIVSSASDLFKAPFLSAVNSQKIVSGVAFGNQKILNQLAQLAEDGLYTPLIDQVFPLDQIAAAHTLADSGRKKGNVIISF